MERVNAIRGHLVEGALILEGLDDAIVGYSDGGLLIYDYEKTVEHFVEDGMTREEAVEWVDFNVLGLQGNGEGFVMLYSVDIDE
jgi:hypothetical protein